MEPRVSPLRTQAIILCRRRALRYGVRPLRQREPSAGNPLVRSRDRKLGVALLGPALELGKCANPDLTNLLRKKQADFWPSALMALGVVTSTPQMTGNCGVW